MNKRVDDLRIMQNEIVIEEINENLQ